jgi:hypothetical protein
LCFRCANIGIAKGTAAAAAFSFSLSSILSLFYGHAGERAEKEGGRFLAG